MGRGGQADCGTNCSGLLAGGGLEKGREVAVEFSGGGVQRRGGVTGSGGKQVRSSEMIDGMGGGQDRID